jgi:molybdopterin synthase sulfur carrier subunit
MINIVFFAALREQLGCDTLSLTTTNIDTVNDVKNQLMESHPQWADFLSNNALLTAINHDMVAADASVSAGDEIAFFPPVTGG